MSQRERLCWILALLLSSMAACGQELVVPQRGQAGATGGVQAPSEGTTGASGAPADVQGGKLPVLDQPVFTTFGGAGGESNDGTDVRTSGGRKSSGGSGGVGGSKSRGGAASLGSAGEGGAGGSSDAPPAPPPARLLFSEYIEDGSDKALEIYALDGGSLEDCELQTYFNGKQEPTLLALHGALAQGELQVLCSSGSSGLAIAHPELCDRSTNLSFNGDDALALSCGGIIQDIIGVIGVDPGDSWGVGATLDHTLQRRCAVTAGRTDNQQPFDIDAEWITYGKDTFSDLGKRSCEVP